MIKKLVASISGSVGLFNKVETIVALGKISNLQTKKINELIEVVNKQEAEINKLKGEK
jgi:hypothetical protein